MGPVHLLLPGIGCILGAGIYVLAGTAAAEFAGPAVTLSFVLAGVACALTALRDRSGTDAAPAEPSDGRLTKCIRTDMVRP